MERIFRKLNSQTMTKNIVIWILLVLSMLIINRYVDVVAVKVILMVAGSLQLIRRTKQIIFDCQSQHVAKP